MYIYYLYITYRNTYTWYSEYLHVNHIVVCACERISTVSACICNRYSKNIITLFSKCIALTAYQTIFSNFPTCRTISWFQAKHRHSNTNASFCIFDSCFRRSFDVTWTESYGIFGELLVQYIHLTCDLNIDVWRFKLWLCLLFLSGIAHCHRHWTQRTCTNSEASKTPLFCSQLKVPQTKWDTVDGRNQANQLIGSFSHYSHRFYASRVMVRRISAKSRIDSPNRPRSAAQNQGPFKMKVASPFTRASQPHWRWVDHG